MAHAHLCPWCEIPVYPDCECTNTDSSHMCTSCCDAVIGKWLKNIEVEKE